MNIVSTISFSAVGAHSASGLTKIQRSGVCASSSLNQYQLNTAGSSLGHRQAVALRLNCSTKYDPLQAQLPLAASLLWQNKHVENTSGEQNGALLREVAKIHSAVQEAQKKRRV